MDLDVKMVKDLIKEEYYDVLDYEEIEDDVFLSISYRSPVVSFDFIDYNRRLKGYFLLDVNTFMSMRKPTILKLIKSHIDDGYNF